MSHVRRNAVSAYNFVLIAFSLGEIVRAQQSRNYSYRSRADAGGAVGVLFRGPQCSHSNAELSRRALRDQSLRHCRNGALGSTCRRGSRTRGRRGMGSVNSVCAAPVPSARRIITKPPLVVAVPT